jgi:hypothetical protein
MHQFAMRKRQRESKLPKEVISLTAYSQLELYLSKFTAGELGLILLLGRHGTGKSECVRRAAHVHRAAQGVGSPIHENALYVEGHMQPFGLYRCLWEFQNKPVILDDLDKLYTDVTCVRILKALCNTEKVRRITWLTNLAMNSDCVPPSFTTRSNVILVANEWHSANVNIRALEDRAIILHFDPSNAEVHRRVGEWFDDQQVYEFMTSVLHLVPSLSMRYYCKGSQLRRAGLSDWRTSLLQMVLPDPRVACIVSLQHDRGLRTEHARVERFISMTGYSRASYFRIKAELVRQACLRIPNDNSAHGSEGAGVDA